MTFTDATGRAWKVYDFSIIAGRTIRYSVGSSSAAYRGFAPVDGGARRLYMFWMKDPHDSTPEVFAAQLAASDLYWSDDPAKMAISRQNGGRPERVDPVERA